jgi:GT2 family glycosyltransferase
MVAAKMLNYHDTGRIDSVGIRVATNGLASNIGVGEADAGQYDTPREVFGACAGAALYRRAMLDDVGFFDAAFFAYYEDTDLAWRGRLAGWRCVTAPGAVVYHVQRNKWYVMVKNWPSTLLFRHLPRIVVYDVASFVLAMLRGRFLPAMRARLRVAAELPALLRKRRQTMHLQKLRTAELARQFQRDGSPLKTFARKMGIGV